MKHYSLNSTGKNEAEKALRSVVANENISYAGFLSHIENAATEGQTQIRISSFFTKSQEEEFIGLNPLWFDTKNY